MSSRDGVPVLELELALDTLSPQAYLTGDTLPIPIPIPITRFMLPGGLGRTVSILW